MKTVPIKNPYIRAIENNLLEAATIGRGLRVEINHHRLRLSPRWWRAFPPDYEKECFAFLEKSLRPGDVAFDVGSHVGLFALVMAQLVGPDGRVVAFEPNPTARRFLNRHVRLNRLSEQIMAEPIALSDKAGEATLYAGPVTADSGSPADPGSSLYAQNHLTTPIAVPVSTVDDYCSRNKIIPRVIKIDVEGYERFVIEGATATLAQGDVYILCEVHVDNMRMIGETPGLLLQTIKRAGYAAFDLAGQPLDSLDRGGHVVFKRVKRNN
ncbi:MAG TPA: FkbM family methyltransferase [Blastocatellia bacterium]|nr:FkbM family methyltransferase [Blastocatellia bacterium]